MWPTTRSDQVRCRVTLDEIGGLQITIPAARSPSLMLFLSVWLISWLIGELAVLASLAAVLFGMKAWLRLGNSDASYLPLITIWLAFWTLAGAVMMDAFIWKFRGREVIGIDPDGGSLVIRRPGTLIPRRSQTFSMDEVRNLRFAPLSLSMFPSPFSFRQNWEAQLQWLGTGGGSIAFDHAGGTQRFGIQLSETESRRLIKTIKDHYKIQDDKDEPLPVERL
jgi:hypothetical protein